MLGLLLLAGCGERESSRSKSHAELAAAALVELEQAVETRDGKVLIPDLGFVASNAQALDVRDFTARWAAEISGSGTGFLGSVQVSYRLGDHDQGETRMTVAMGFGQRDGQSRVVTIGGHDEQTPLWLAGPVQVREGANTLVMAAESVPTGDVDLIAKMSKRARSQVQKVIASPGSLVVEIPGSEEQLNQLLQAESGQYDNIAAVATTPDGSLVPGSPVHVFINPELFMTMKGLGAPVVLTHEATHVATQALFADIPAWLREGFADQVALADGRIPVETAAAQYLKEIRRNGLPVRFPDDADLDPRSAKFGASYEASWLLCRTIAAHFGQQRLVDLYDDSSERSDHEVAFEEVLGVSEAEVLELWRSDLAELSGTRG